MPHFFDEYIVKHFKFEEEEIFSLILKHGNEKEKRMVQGLQNDHLEILNKLADFMKTVSFYGSQPNEKQIEDIMSSSRELLEMILRHARKEDLQLFPNL